MLPIETARLLLLAAVPAPSQWRGPAATRYEQEVLELVQELTAIRELLWL